MHADRVRRHVRVQPRLRQPRHPLRERHRGAPGLRKSTRSPGRRRGGIHAAYQGFFGNSSEAPVLAAAQKLMTPMPPAVSLRWHYGISRDIFEN